MSGRTSIEELGRRIAHKVMGETAEDLRNARLTRGLTQDEVGSSIGTSRARVAAVEHRVSKSMTIEQIARQAAALGLKLSVKLYPVGDPIRDAAQVRYITKFLDRVGRAWKVGLDVPIPLPGDLRAIDVVLSGPCVIAVEVVTRLRDIQAVIRSAQLKQRDLGATRLVIVVAGSEANRRAIATARTALAPVFELDTRQVMRALANGEDPGRDAIVVLD